ncbi:hypothetical protein BGZ65_002937 [Modicella reniformis]|uniref:Uncharacterized protein n=1 Tax=Modicella reniformis TaxID=1440133 RepID=A0A9P6LST9_9FUNG|nr:hypothetical protein BGZ65_002937 [Modicella reniformis]
MTKKPTKEYEAILDAKYGKFATQTPQLPSSSGQLCHINPIVDKSTLRFEVHFDTSNKELNPRELALEKPIIIHRATEPLSEPTDLRRILVREVECLTPQRIASRQSTSSNTFSRSIARSPRSSSNTLLMPSDDNLSGAKSTYTLGNHLSKQVEYT